jgi:hypothetical protein
VVERSICLSVAKGVRGGQQAAQQAAQAGQLAAALAGLGRMMWYELKVAADSVSGRRRRLPIAATCLPGARPGLARDEQEGFQLAGGAGNWSGSQSSHCLACRIYANIAPAGVSPAMRACSPNSAYGSA